MCWRCLIVRVIYSILYVVNVPLGSELVIDAVANHEHRTNNSINVLRQEVEGR